jgi:hypothetical protein
MKTLFSFPALSSATGATCDALLTGEFVAYLPGERVETHLGPIDFLDAANEPLYPSINPVGPGGGR